jgi:hypothetical protein
LLSNLKPFSSPQKQISVERSSPVVVREEKIVVVIQDRSGSMEDFISELDDQLMKRKLGNQYIFFACSVERRDDMRSVDVGQTTHIFPAFKEMFYYLEETLPKRVDIVFISDGEDNNMIRCRTEFARHIGKFESDVPGIQEHRFFTIGVGPRFPTNLVGNACMFSSSFQNLQTYLLFVIIVCR